MINLILFSGTLFGYPVFIAVAIVTVIVTVILVRKSDREYEEKMEKIIRKPKSDSKAKKATTADECIPVVVKDVAYNKCLELFSGRDFHDVKLKRGEKVIVSRTLTTLYDARTNEEGKAVLLSMLAAVYEAYDDNGKMNDSHFFGDNVKVTAINEEYRSYRACKRFEKEDVDALVQISVERDEDGRRHREFILPGGIIIEDKSELPAEIAKLVEDKKLLNIVEAYTKECKNSIYEFYYEYGITAAGIPYCELCSFSYKGRIAILEKLIDYKWENQEWIKAEEISFNHSGDWIRRVIFKADGNAGIVERNIEYAIVESQSKQIEAEVKEERLGKKETIAFYEADFLDGELVKYNCDNVYTYVYDIEGRKVEEFWTEEGVRTEWRYDADGRCVVERQTNDTDGLTCMLETLRSYNGKGDVIVEQHKTWENYVNVEVVEVKYDNEYDEQGRLVKSFNKTEKSMVTFEYSDGRLSARMSCSEDGVLHHKEKYDIKGLKIAEYDYSPDRTLKQITQYKYDKFGNLVEKRTENAQKKLILKIYNDYKYDKNGEWINCLSSTTTDEGTSYKIKERSIRNL
jgi:hypothetical protein